MKKPTLNIKSGFSLVELLVVIAVIAVIAAIAIPNIAGITGAAGDSKTLRNAQTVASIFNSARAAGYNANIATADDAIDAVATGTGITGGADGLAAGMNFGCLMSDTEVTAVKTLAATGVVTISNAGTSSVLNYQSEVGAASSSGF